jgi:hypothetical protein
LAWTISYTARKQLRKLDKPTARRILDFMDERVAARYRGGHSLNSVTGAPVTKPPFLDRCEADPNTCQHARRAPDRRRETLIRRPNPALFRSGSIQSRKAKLR